MIAIAGAKGGCGKTTTAIGLAQAFDREDVLSLVVDADRQLPNLHAAAGVDREPTVAAIDEGGDILETAQPLPGTKNAGVLPAPKRSEEANLQVKLDKLTHDSLEVLIDCPAGAGPDTVEPIAYADKVVIVTTGTSRSLQTAQKTIEIARQVDTPIVGAILNRCQDVPFEFRSQFDIPLLGTIPPCESPITNDKIDPAYDHIAQELLSQSQSKTPIASTPKSSEVMLSTGVDKVDTALHGGLPSGSVVTLSAEPESQSELLLHAFTRTRGTLYITPKQSKEVVESSLESSVVQTGEPTIRHLNSDNKLEEAKQLLQRLPDHSNVIIDTMDLLEQNDQESYRQFLNTLMECVRSTDSIAMLHVLDRTPTPRNRVTTERFADIVLRLETARTATGVSQHLTVPKSRRDGISIGSTAIDLTEVLSGKDKVDPVSILNDAG